jgi:hypothetical protein
MLPMPSQEALKAQFRDSYRLIEAVGEPVIVEVRAPDGSFEEFGPVAAKVANFAATDILQNAVLRQGDLKAILHGAGWLALGLPKLEQTDRVRYRGRAYSVLRFDDASHSIGGEVFAVELVLRG